MSRRLFLFFIALFCMFGILLLLSALTVSSAVEEALPDEQSTAHAFTTTLFTMPPSPTTSSPVSACGWLRIAALFAAALLILPCLTCICDANGRVLCQKRYVRSFYPVFKQDLACG